MLTGWLTQTKFIPPRLRDDFVSRRRLLETLHSAIHASSLVLLSAPPGYGKTTFLGSLPAAFPTLPIAWLSLDDDDNDPARFLVALVRALQQTHPDFGRNIEALMASMLDPAVETRRVASALINEMLEDLPETWIILDDLHLITEPVIHTALEYMLERMPPHVRLLIGTRHDPPLSLARLRARGHLLELRATDLRFSNDEAALFLNDKQHLDLSLDDLARLQSCAEGWAAGLRLLAGSLDRIHSADDRAAFIRDLALLDRHVFDFLAEEALKRLEPEIRKFLLETSILVEMTATLCNAITGRNDAHDVLEDLYHRNLFFTQVGDKSRTYRYHALFAEFLREQLGHEHPDRLADLHIRAAQAQETLAPTQAVAHYLAAQSWEEAAQCIEQLSEELLHRGWFRSLRSWIEALPTGMRDAHPRLLYLLGLCALQHGELHEAATLLESARHGFRSAGDQAGQGEALLLLIDAASRDHDYARQAALTQEALAFPLPVQGQVQLLMAQVWQSLFQGDAKGADDALDEALGLTLPSSDVRTFRVMAPLLNMHLAFLPGGAVRLEQYCRHVLSLFGNEAGLVQACAHSLLGYLLFLSGSADECAREVERARTIFKEIGGLAYSEAQALAVRGLLTQSRGEYPVSEKLWTEFLPRAERTHSLRPYVAASLYFIGRAQWMQGRIDQARQTEARISAIVDQDEYPETTMTRRLMRALIEIGDRNFAAAERALQEGLHIERQWVHGAIFGSARVLLAYLHLQCKREQEAWSQFGPFLGECERRNMPGLILQETVIAIPLLRLALERGAHADFAERLLDQLSASDSPRPVPIPGTGQTLTRREVEVLRLIGEGASNRAIATRLVISEHTVKAHITSIYAKLQVASRTQAVVRARELSLL